MGEAMSADPLDRMEQGLKITSWLWTLGVIVTVVGIWMLEAGTVGGRGRVRLEQVMFTAWTVGPPAWFVVQHYVWPAPPGGQDRFKSHQALVRAVWAGVAALLAAIIFGRWG
jgi:hypothetical protein